MPTQSERRDATKKAIIDAATRAYEGGDLSVSLEVIGADAGVTKGSIFYHFGSRAGLLRAVALVTLARLERRLAQDLGEIDLRTWVRMVLAEQMTPRGRMLFAINDELALIGELGDIDPFPYLTLRLREFDVSAPPTVIAAAMLQYARQLAFGNAAGGDLDDVMADLDGLL